MKTWDELVHGERTDDRALIIQFLATATTHPAYSKMTFKEVYDLHVQRTEEYQRILGFCLKL